MTQVKRYTSGRAITNAIFDAIALHINAPGETAFPHSEKIGWWFTVAGTSRSQRPSKEFVEEALVEKLQRDMSVLPADLRLSVVKLRNHDER